MKYSWVIISSACLAGCMASNGLQYDAISQNNLYHIAKVRKGMSEKQVIQIMHKPYSYESFEAGEDVYDVWFYVTRPTGLDQTRMVPQNLTPLTFKNGILVGTGYQWYYFAMKAQAEQVATENPTPPKKTPAEEDVEFENALRSFKPQTTPAPAPAAPAPAPRPTTLLIGESQEEKYADLFKGMTQEQVAAVLGTPGQTENFDLDEEPYEVWFYDPISPPITFKNGLLVGLSADYYLGVKEIVQREKQEPLSMGPPSFVKPWTPSIAAAPKTQLSQAKVGMTESEVTDLLGAPSRYESYTLNEDVYDVWFYDDQTPPLTFKNSVLVGKSKSYYKKIQKSATLNPPPGYNPAGERLQEDESEQNFNYW